MITGVEEVDRKFADRVRLLEDKNVFLIAVDIVAEESLVQELMSVTEEIFEKKVLDEPEALAIAIAVKEGCRYVLSDDVIAKRVLEALEKIYPERKLPEILNTGDILNLALEKFVLYFPSEKKAREFIEGFEREARITLSRESKRALIDVWKSVQAEKEI